LFIDVFTNHILDSLKTTIGGENMSDQVLAKIKANPKYQHLKNTRTSLGILLSILMLIVYYGFIALVAFNKEFLGTPIGGGVTSIGIPMALGVILFTIAVTAIYVNRANGEFDKLTAEILEESK
jgi:uncharacterized membrane protein (DUF485 family)